MAGAKIAKCGTRAGYMRHRKLRREACDACRRANVDYINQRNWTTGVTVRREVAPCGTLAAYARHIRRGEVVDEPCRLVKNEYQRARKAARRRGEVSA